MWKDSCQAGHRRRLGTDLTCARGLGLSSALSTVELILRCVRAAWAVLAGEDGDDAGRTAASCDCLSASCCSEYACMVPCIFIRNKSGGFLTFFFPRAVMLKCFVLCLGKTCCRKRGCVCLKDLAP